MAERPAALRRVSEVPMTEGLYARALEGPRLAPAGPSPARRAGVVIVALAVAAVGGALLVRAMRTEQVPATLVDETYGMMLDVPFGWVSAPLVTDDVSGFTLASWGEVPPSSATGWILEPDVPDGEALVQIGGGDGNWTPEQPLPLDLARDGHGPPTGPLRSMNFIVRAAGWGIFIMYGDDVSPAIQDDVADIVASVRFQPLRDPATGHAIDDQGVLSLGPGDRFPAGSVTRVRVDDGALEGQLLWVVRAPVAPYAFSATWIRDAYGCDLRWLDDEQVFACGEARWDVRANAVNAEAEVMELSYVQAGGVDPDGRIWVSRDAMPNSTDFAWG